MSNVASGTLNLLLDLRIGDGEDVILERGRLSVLFSGMLTRLLIEIDFGGEEGLELEFSVHGDLRNGDPNSLKATSQY